MTPAARQYTIMRMCLVERERKSHRLDARRLCQRARLMQVVGIDHRRLLPIIRQHRAIALSYGRELTGLIRDIQENAHAAR